MPLPPMPDRTPLEALGALAMSQGGHPLRALRAGDADRLLALVFPAQAGPDDGQALRAAFTRSATRDPLPDLREALAAGGGSAAAEGLDRYLSHPLGRRLAERVHGAAAQFSLASPRPGAGLRPAGAPAGTDRLAVAAAFLALPVERQHVVYAALLKRGHGGLPIPFGAWRGEELVASVGTWSAAAVADLARLSAMGPAAAAGFQGAPRAFSPGRGLPPMPARPPSGPFRF